MIPDRPTVAPGFARETIVSAKSSRGFNSMFAITTSNVSVSVRILLVSCNWFLLMSSISSIMEELP